MDRSSHVPEPSQTSAILVTHTWLELALGRICERCLMVQENGAFNDSTPCAGATPNMLARLSTSQPAVDGHGD